MKFAPRRRGASSKGVDAFTLAEVLAALMFMAIVIPVAVQGLRVSSRAGALAERKREAVRAPVMHIFRHTADDPGSQALPHAVLAFRQEQLK